MSVNSLPLSFGKVETGKGQVTTSRAGQTTIASPSAGSDLVLLFTAGPNHGGYDLIEVQLIKTSGTPTPAATLIHIWETDSSGANADIVRTETLAAGAIMNTGVKGPNMILTFNRADLQTGIKVFASVETVTANTAVNFTLRGGQFEAQ